MLLFLEQAIVKSIYIDNQKKSFLVLGKYPTQELVDTMVTAEAYYSVNFSRPKIKFCLSLHERVSSKSDLLMPQKHISSKQNSEITPNPLCLGNISKHFTVGNMTKRKQD